MKKRKGGNQKERKERRKKVTPNQRPAQVKPTPLSTLSLVATCYSKTKKKRLANSHVKAAWPKEIPCVEKSKGGKEKKKKREKID